MFHILKTEELNGVNIDIIFATFVATIVLLILSSFGLIFTIIYKKKQQLYLSEKQILETVFQEQLLRSQLEIKEQTLQHLSHELHDNVGQIASLIKINLNTLNLNDYNECTQKIESTKELTRQLIYDLKSLSTSLSSDKVNQIGIVKSLEKEIGRINKIGQFEADFQYGEYIPDLDSNITIILYRMVQEILNNAVKHSQAKNINISIQASGNLLTLICFDNGIGFDLEEKQNNDGLGLLHLYSRAKLINAKLIIHSVLKTGTTVIIELSL